MPYLLFSFWFHSKVPLQTHIPFVPTWTTGASQAHLSPMEEPHEMKWASQNDQNFNNQIVEECITYKHTSVGV